MYKKAQKKKERKKFTVIAIIIGVLMIIAIAFTLLLTLRDAPPPQVSSPEVTTENEEVPPKESSLIQSGQPYTNSHLGFSLHYPDGWLKLECEGRPDQVFFASDERGLGFYNGQSILCGGGTDFPAQIQIRIRDSAEAQPFISSANNILIDDETVYKNTQTYGDMTLYPDLTSTVYLVEHNGRYIEFIYNKQPAEKAEDYDISEESEQKFIHMIENTLTFTR